MSTRNPVYEIDAHGSVYVECGHCHTRVQPWDTGDIMVGRLMKICTDCRKQVRADGPDADFCGFCEKAAETRWIPAVKKAKGCSDCVGEYTRLLAKPPKSKTGRPLTPFLKG